MILQDPRGRLRALSLRYQTRLGELSVMIGRGRGYFARYVRDGVPTRLLDADRAKLAAFFGVSEVELGGDDPRWKRWRDLAFHTTERKLGFECQVDENKRSGAVLGPPSERLRAFE